MRLVRLSRLSLVLAIQLLVLIISFQAGNADHRLTGKGFELFIRDEQVQFNFSMVAVNEKYVYFELEQPRIESIHYYVEFYFSLERYGVKQSRILRSLVIVIFSFL